MKRIMAKYANGVLMALAATFVFTASAYFMHRPETPAELLKK